MVDNEVNKQITVLDDKTQPSNDPVVLGTATWNPEGTPTEFPYTLEVRGEAGKTVEYTNTAWIKETEQSDDVTVKVTTEKPLFPAPSQPKPPSTPSKPMLPLTGLDNTGMLVSIGAVVTLLGTSLILGTKRRKEE